MALGVNVLLTKFQIFCENIIVLSLKKISAFEISNMHSKYNWILCEDIREFYLILKIFRRPT